MNQTPHQERSAETLQNLDTIIQLYTPVEKQWIRDNVYIQMVKLGVWNIKNYMDAKADREKGGEGLVHTVTFDN